MIFILILSIFFGAAEGAFAWQSPNITDIRFCTHPDYTRVVFDLNSKLSYRINRDGYGSIVVDFPRGIVSQNSVIKVSDNIVEDIKIARLGRGIRARLNLGKEAGSYKTILFEKPYRLVIDVRKSHIIQAGLPKKDHEIKVVILDAGHGGKDPGAIGRRGLREKIVVLDIARRTEKLLKRTRQVKVILTRRRDEFISLDKRVKIANKNKGALFISIHTNSHSHKSAGGFETFYLGEPKTDDARTVAMLENSVLGLEERAFLSDMGRTLEKILWDLRLNEFRIESKELAESVQKNLDKCLYLKNRGIKGSLFYVLRGTAMPAALVETAFISNAREESLLKRASFRQAVAQAIYTSIFQYKNTFEKSRGFTD
jgi:N-acetylmuramoyl-L-alanine amidase